MKKKLTIEFVQQAKLIHGNKYDYSLVDYKNNRTKVKIICNKCGNQFEQTPSSHLKYKEACKCSINHGKKTLEDFIKKSKSIWGNKYDYSLSEYKDCNTKVKLICKECGNIIEQLPNNHYNFDCYYCSYEKRGLKQQLTREQFIEEAKLVHNDKYDYSLVDYNGLSKNIKIICPIHGIFEQKALNHINNHGCPICNNSKGEEKINVFVKNKKIVFEKTKKYDDLIDISQLSYDFYLPEYNLLVEYNGSQHYSNTFKKPLHDFHKQLHHDWLKRKYAKSHNINLLVIPYWDFDNIEKILEDYLSSLE